MTSTNPYADAYNDYWSAGWRGVLPLPYKAKKNPPTGYTGAHGADPSYPDCTAWADEGPRNICLHLPDTIIGLDVDNYGGKGGGATLGRLVDAHGPLPATWLSTSRGDGISGIRLFRVPAGTRLKSAIPGGIELIQKHHRYIVCWPSIHPETDSPYQWVDEATGESGVPRPDQLPHLPAAWIDALTDTGTSPDKADITTEQARAFWDALPNGDPCQHILAAAGYAMSGKDRHDAYNGAALGVLDRGRSGCPGARDTLGRLRKSFIAEVTAPGTTGRRTEAEAAAEWQRNILGGIAIVTHDHPDQGHGCPDDYLAELILNEQQDNADDEQPDDEATRAYRLKVARRAAELQLADDARDLHQARTSNTAPPLAAVDLTAFLAQPDSDIAWRINKVWPEAGRILLAAAAKAGKTTLILNLLRCLADGGDFLGVWSAQRTDQVVYLNLEVGADQMRRWLRRANITNTSNIHVANLRGQAAALTLGSAAGRKRVSRWLADHGAATVILDPLAPLLGALGLDENSNSDIAKFFAWWTEVLHDAGVRDDLIAHHFGHGQGGHGRSRGASRLMDEPDALWTISKDQALDDDGDDMYDQSEPRFFKAVGRDVEEPEKPLEFDGASGLLTLGEGNRKQMRTDAVNQRAERAIMMQLGENGPSTQNQLCRKGGNYQTLKDALGRLVHKGLVVATKAGQANIYTLSTQPTPPTPTDTRCQVSVTDTTPI